MDLTVPTSHGPGPGNGALVNLVAQYAGRRPHVAGKPEAPLFEETLARVRGRRPLVIGDRIDTDIDGAHNVGWDSLLVMTGVTTIHELATLPGPSRPTYVAADLGCLTLPVATPEPSRDGFAVGGWTAGIQHGRLSVTGDGDRHDWWRAAAAALWSHRDTTGASADPGDAVLPR
jgi:glycerol 3-phosphatase-2